MAFAPCPKCGRAMASGRTLCEACSNSSEAPAAAAAAAALIRCPDCGKDVSPRAAACPSCGAPIAPAPATTVQPAQNAGIAAVLSLVIPGAGQMYQGDIGGGIGWLFAVVFFYVIFLPLGVIAHLACVVLAARGPKPGSKHKAFQLTR